MYKQTWIKPMGQHKTFDPSHRYNFCQPLLRSSMRTAADRYRDRRCAGVRKLPALDMSLLARMVYFKRARSEHRTRIA